MPGVLRLVPRGSNPMRSKRLRSALKIGDRPAKATKSTPDPPGPPGLRNSDPMRSGPVAGSRSSAMVAVPAAGLR